MKKIFTKTLLLAALLAGGVSSAWADAEVIYGRAMTTDGDYTAWSASDVAASGTNVWIGNFAYNETYGLYGTGNGSRQSVMTFNHAANSFQTFDIVFDNLGNTGNTSNYSYLRIGSAIEIQSNQQNQTGAVIINGVSNAISDCNKKNYNRGGDKWTIHVEINTLSKEVTALTLVGTTMNGKSAHYTLTSATSLGSTPTFNTVTIGTVRAGGTPSAALTSIKIAEEAQAVTNVGYTVNYKLGENLVKSVSGEDAVDAVITAETAIDGTEEGYVDNHYLITAADAPTMTLVANAASNVLEVSVRAPYTATLNVTTTVGTNDPVLVSTPLVETDAKVCAWTYVYPMYVLNGGKYYIADNISTFGEGGEFTDGQVINKYVKYSNVDESVVFFQEAETSAGGNYSYSNGGKGVVGAQNKRDRGISVGTLPAGVYSFVVNIVAANRRSLGIRQSTNDFLAFVGTSNEDMTTGVKSANFTLNEETSSLFINGANSGTEKTNQSEDFDYVLIKKLPATVSKSITAAGYATFCSEYALDFTDVDGLTAYIAKTDGEKDITFKPVTTIPANTGVLLQGNKGDYNIPVIASADAVVGNVFVGVLTSTEVAADNFVLMDGTNGVGFYSTPDAFTVGANTAYLPASVASGRSFIWFEESGTTAIQAPVVKNLNAGEIYTLGGQRVAKPTKGLYIMNGKKVVVK